MIRWKLTLSLLPVLVNSLFVDDSIHHAIEYRIPDDKSTLLEEDDEYHVVIRTRDNEQYTCALPDADKETVVDLNGYNGPTPWDLIAPLKDHNICTQRIDPFWSYEICHGKYIRQYHQSKDEKLSFYLGNFHPTYATLYTEQSEKERIKVNGEDLPFLPVLYSQGTTCDLTGQPRKARVLYICYPTPREVIESITEVSTCNYDVVVLTQLICSHPRFHKVTSSVKKIVCTTSVKGTGPIPKAYTPLAKAQNQLFHTSFAPTEDRVLKRTTPRDFQESEDLTNLVSKMETSQGYHKQADLRFSARGMESVLAGVNCLDNGGSDYWKYEYCHLKKITQYHQSGNARVDVSLGVFIKQKHLDYLKANPSKRPNRYEDKISQVVHFYSLGQKCGDNAYLDFYRSAEVRIRCPSKESKEDLEFTVSEPTMCNYIITLESDRLCEAIQKADNDGLF